jgi:hypothetical protein
MSEIDRAELARLASEAGQGPCTIKRDYYNHPVVRFGELGSGIAHFSYGPSETNAAFVVAACNAVPVLLAQLAAAEQERDRLAMDALCALSGAKVVTPLDGYVKRPHDLWRNIKDLAAERDALRDAIVGE